MTITKRVTFIAKEGHEETSFTPLHIFPRLD